jgi:hypothetical protein
MLVGLSSLSIFHLPFSFLVFGWQFPLLLMYCCLLQFLNEMHVHVSYWDYYNDQSNTQLLLKPCPALN